MQTAMEKRAGVPENPEGFRPLPLEYMCSRGVDYFHEWVEAGMPRRDRQPSKA